MSRRRKQTKRDVSPDPVYKSKVVTKFMNSLMYQGKKTVAEKILYKTFELIKTKTNDDPLKIFYDALKNVKPNTKIVYWGSENPSKQPLPISNPWDAYKNYKNSGVTTSNKEGTAALKLFKPVSYKIPNGMTLKPHIHYREVLKDGMLGPVETASI